MNLDLTDSEVTLVLQALGELPAKISFNLLQKLGGQVADEQNARRQQAPPTSEGLAAGTD